MNNREISARRCLWTIGMSFLFMGLAATVDFPRAGYFFAGVGMGFSVGVCALELWLKKLRKDVTHPSRIGAADGD